MLFTMGFKYFSVEIFILPHSSKSKANAMVPSEKMLTFNCRSLKSLLSKRCN